MYSTYFILSMAEKQKMLKNRKGGLYTGSTGAGVSIYLLQHRNIYLSLLIFIIYFT